MTLIFPLLVLLGFIAWLCAALPSLRIPEWVARAFFLAAAIIWFVKFV